MTEVKFLCVSKFNLNLPDDAKPMTIPTDVKRWLLDRYSSPHNFGVDDLLRNSSYRYLGFLFKFQMPTYLYQDTATHQWHQAYAPNKTALRKAVFGRISRIITLTDDLK